MNTNHIQFDQLVEQASKIMITSHIRPDADAIGSVLAVKHYLKAKFPQKQTKVFISSEPTHMWDFVDKEGDVNWVDDIADVIHQFDLVIFLDGNHLTRFSDKAEHIDLKQFQSICIDHHPNQPDKFTLDLSENSAAANCQNIYTILFQQQQQLLTQQSIKALLVGIVGDTGTFRYINPRNSSVLEIAKRLIDLGEIDIQQLELDLTQITSAELDLIQVLVNNTRNIFLPGLPGLSYTYLPVDALKKYPNEHILKNAVSQYMYMFLRKIDNCKWGFVVSPRTKFDISISLRSTPGSPNVQDIAAQFNGGGHVLASGGQYIRESNSDLDCDGICQLILDKIKTMDIKFVN